MEKMTYVKALDAVLNNEEMTKEVIEKLIILRASIVKKSAADRKPTAQQVANQAIQKAILNAMENARLYTISDLAKSVPECADLSNQRISALMRQLKDGGFVERVEEKRKAYFRKFEQM